MGPMDDPVFRALVEQAKRVCPKHPDLAPAYMAAIREKGRGIRPDQLQAILDEVAKSAPKANEPGRETRGECPVSPGRSANIATHAESGGRPSGDDDRGGFGQAHFRFGRADLPC